MTAQAWQFYDAGLVGKNEGLNLETATLKVGLYKSTSNAATLTVATIPNVAAITNECDSTGYTAGGFTVAGTVTGESQNVNFDTEDAQWTAGAGGITARFAVLFSGTVPIAVSLLDTTPADVTATEGNTFTVAPHTDGVFDEAPA